MIKKLQALREKYKIFLTIKRIRNKEGELHFLRYSLFSCKRFSIFKHIITQHDNEKHEHDHPWNFLSFIWSGSYTELTHNVKRRRRRFSFKFFKAIHQHRLLEVHNKRCVTFIITGERFREWGYPTEKGWVDNIEYRKLKRNGKL